MGEVWRALKVGPTGYAWSRQVALKIILPMFAREARFREMFIAEARIAASLVHPNIVTVTDFGVEKEMLWLEQELVDGTNCSRLLECSPSGLPGALALYVTCEALKGLSHAHAHESTQGGVGSVVHRDVKPSNLLISKDGHVKVTDFGIAKVVRADPSLTDIKGTIGYIAPELLEGHTPTERSDLFAVGLVLWELLTGRKLFGGDNEAARLFRTYECLVPPLASAGIEAPHEVEAALRRLLARNPAERFQSAHDALIALLAAPGGRSASSMDLKAHLLAVGIRPMSASIPPFGGGSDTPIAPRTATMAGETAHPVGFWRRGRLIAAAGVLVAAVSGLVALAVTAAGSGANPASAPIGIIPAASEVPPPPAPGPVVLLPDAGRAAPPPAPSPPPSPAPALPDAGHPLPSPVAAPAPFAGAEITRNPPPHPPMTKGGSRKSERPAPAKQPQRSRASDKDKLMEPE